MKWYVISWERKMVAHTWKYEAAVRVAINWGFDSIIMSASLDSAKDIVRAIRRSWY